MRYNTKWYQRRSRRNKIFSTYLVDIINQYRDPDFILTDDELKMLSYEDLGEIACVVVNKSLSLVLGSHRDFDDYSDFKCVVSQDRNNVIYNPNTRKSSWLNSYAVAGTKNKVGALRVLAFNAITEQFEHFLIPAGEYDNTVNRLEIVIQRCQLPLGTNPNFNGIYNPDITSCKWYKYRVDDFEAMCGIDLTESVESMTLIEDLELTESSQDQCSPV